jgi:hypothetical protein
MGRPKGSLNDKPWKDAIRKAVARRVEDGGRTLDKLAEKLVACAEAGEGWAFTEMGNRLDGKPHQSSDVTINDERLVARMPEPAKDADEWAADHAPVTH